MPLLKRLFFGFSLLLSGLSLCLALICLGNGRAPLLYLIDIFTLPILSFTVLLTAVLLVARQKIAGIIGLVASLMLALALWPQALPAQRPAVPSQPAIRVVFANVFIRNAHPDRVLPWVEAQNPDIVALVETNSFVRQPLMTALQARYPYIATRYDMVVASRYPLADAHPRPPGFALLTLKVDTPQGPLTLAVAHLTRPWPFKSPQDQPRQFDRLFTALQPLAGQRMVVVGDFNTPPCAVLMQDFTHGLRLHTAPATFGTWLSVLPGFLRINIDNAMASDDLNLSRRLVGPLDGSDHRPIVVDIRPARLAP